MAEHLNPDSPPRLEVSGLVKRYRNHTAVDGLSFAVAPGELVGFVGPNGAGKSTTVKIISGQLRADAGVVRVDGHDVSTSPLAARRRTGYVPQALALYPFLTGREVLEFVSDVRGIPAAEASTRIDRLLARFGLADAQHRLTREYSEGMARKLAVATALVHDPAVLVLDESLTGLDPRAVAEVKAVVRERLTGGGAVLFISHLLDVVEALATRVLVVDRGQLVAELDRDALNALRGAGRTLEEVFLESTEPPTT